MHDPTFEWSWTDGDSERRLLPLTAVHREQILLGHEGLPDTDDVSDDDGHRS